MRHFLKTVLSCLLALSVVLSMAAAVSAENEPLKFTALYACADAEHPEVRILPQTIGQEQYLFLPSHMKATEAIVYFETSLAEAVVTAKGAVSELALTSGTAFDLTALCGEGSAYRLTLTAKVGEQTAEQVLNLVPTNGIASMYLVSDDPVEHGRAWVEASPTKSNKATGTMVMSDAEGALVYDGKLTQIKGRGNSTWLAEKKPYQIKLKSKTDLLQTGEKANAAKTWVLLTNAADPSLLRNNIVYDLSVAMQIDPGIECRPVNLYYDGEYRGAYLLCEKVEINSGRVDITDLEKAIENANPDTDLEKLTVKSGTTKNGATYYYCDGAKDPENITGGYLLEMESPSRAQQEVCYFTTARSQSIVVKSPEFCGKAVMEYIASWYQEYEDTVYNGGKHPTNGKTLADYADIDSIAQCYIVNELTKNPDGYRTSAYLYKDADTNVCKVGPVWDYDLSFGISWGDFGPNCANPQEFFTLRSSLGTALYAIPEFRQAVHDIYLNIVNALMKNVLCAEKTPGEVTAMQSLNDYAAELKNAAAANGILWGTSPADWEANINALRAYITTRNEWLTAQYTSWSAEGEPAILGYVDVSTDDWFYNDVTRATEYGILNGMNYGIFAPDKNTTRAQATKVLYAISGAERYPFESIFSDVHSYDWFYPAVVWANKKDVVRGYEDGSFRPDNNITRQEFITLLYRYLGEPTVKTDKLSAFKDSAAVANYARTAMRWAAENDVLKGYEDQTIRPEDNMTRAEMSALIVRFYESFIIESDK